MKESPPTGMNRTGIQMSPFDSNAMQSSIPPASAVPPGDETALAAIRSAYIDEADPVGSVPIPATISGAVTTALQALSGNSPQIFLDKLGERLAFERTGTRLYDALITKYQALHDGIGTMSLADLEKIRADEARHFKIVANAIESLGADPTAETPSADLVGVESLGLMQVISDPRTTLAQSLHAILTAELADESGWEMLVAMADDHQQAAMSSDFNVALDEERLHLQLVKQWYEEAVLGAPLTTAPPNGGATRGNGARNPTP